MLAYILGITKRGQKGIANRVRSQRLPGRRDYKEGQLKGFPLGAKRLQIRAIEITNRDRDFNSGQGLQIGGEQETANGSVLLKRMFLKEFSCVHFISTKCVSCSLSSLLQSSFSYLKITHLLKVSIFSFYVFN